MPISVLRGNLSTFSWVYQINGEQNLIKPAEVPRGGKIILCSTFSLSMMSVQVMCILSITFHKRARPDRKCPEGTEQQKIHLEYKI